MLTQHCLERGIAFRGLYCAAFDLHHFFNCDLLQRALLRQRLLATTPLDGTMSSMQPCPGTPQRERYWRHFSHDADIGIQGFGPTPAAAFEEAARALTAAVTDARVEPRIEVSVECRASSLEGLFVDWLNAVIYEMSVRQMLFGDFRVALEGTKLQATLFGEPVDVAKHAPACEPKGATYTALKVAETGRGGWSASCIVDV